MKFYISIFLLVCSLSGVSAQSINVQLLESIDTFNQYGVGQLDYILTQQDTQITQVNIALINLEYSLDQVNWYHYDAFPPLKYLYPKALSESDTLDFFISLFPLFLESSGDSAFDIKIISDIFLKISIGFNNEQNSTIKKATSNIVLRKMPQLSDEEYNAILFIRSEIYPHDTGISYLTTPLYTGTNYYLQNKLKEFKGKYPNSELNNYLELDKLWKDFNLTSVHTDVNRQNALNVLQYLESLKIKRWASMITALQSIAE